jgi:hypothetical protein
MVDFVMSVRGVSDGAFDDTVGSTQFLIVPDGVNPAPIPPQIAAPADWFKQVIDSGKWTNTDGKARGDILFIVHGYNNSESDVMTRHRQIKQGLAANNFKGVVVSFDWPCGTDALAYLIDRHKAKLTAFQLVDDGIWQLSARQTPDCPINVHVLGHSTGAYVIREAFDDADDSQVPHSAWIVSQILFAAGDVSVGSMSEGESGALSVYNHCVRLTNYSNANDAVLDISNVKRAGIAPRAGRKGLPDDAPANAYNVDCTEYYGLYSSDPTIPARDGPLHVSGAQSHSWYFGNAIFTLDLFQTIIGFPSSPRTTRATGQDGKLHLVRAPGQPPV